MYINRILYQLKKVCKDVIITITIIIELIERKSAIPPSVCLGGAGTSYIYAAMLSIFSSWASSVIAAIASTID